MYRVKINPELLEEVENLKSKDQERYKDFSKVKKILRIITLMIKFTKEKIFK